MATVSEFNENLKVVFGDGNEIVLKRPNRAVLGQMLAATRRDLLGAADVIVSQCMLEGDKAAIKGNTGYCHQLIKLTDDIFNKQACLLEFADGKAEILFSDDKRCALRPATRAEYSAAQAASRINPLRYIEDLIRTCWVDGDQDIRTSPAHLLGLAEIMDEFVSYTGENIKN